MKIRTLMVASALLTLGLAAGCDKKEAAAPAPQKAEAKAVEAPPAPAKEAATVAAGEPADPAATCGGGGDCAEKGEKAAGEGIADESVACKHSLPDDVAKKAAEQPAPSPTEADKEKVAELAKLAEKTSHFGAPFAQQSFVSFTDLASDTDQFDGKSVRLDATIKSVCKKAGCWMILADGGDQGTEIRVKMKDHAFAVPRDCDGKRSVVEGVFMKSVTTEAVLKHYEQDAGRDPALIKGDKVELVMIASGVDVIDP